MVAQCRCLDRSVDSSGSGAAGAVYRCAVCLAGTLAGGRPDGVSRICGVLIVFGRGVGLAEDSRAAPDPRDERGYCCVVGC